MSRPTSTPEATDAPDIPPPTVLDPRRWAAVQLSFPFEDRARVATPTPSLLKAA